MNYDQADDALWLSRNVPPFDQAKEISRLQAMPDEDWLRGRIDELEKRAGQLRGCTYLGVSPESVALMEASRFRAILRRLEERK